MLLPSFDGNPAVTNVTNAASLCSLHLAKACSIRPLCPRDMDSTFAIVCCCSDDDDDDDEDGDITSVTVRDGGMGGIIMLE
jgi:hypothetical protein